MASPVCSARLSRAPVPTQEPTDAQSVRCMRQEMKACGGGCVDAERSRSFKSDKSEFAHDQVFTVL